MSGINGIEFRVHVLTNEDRPGISKIMVGDQLLFDGGTQKVLQAEVRVMVPFHTHFEEPRLACVWKE